MYLSDVSWCVRSRSTARYALAVCQEAVMLRRNLTRGGGWAGVSGLMPQSAPVQVQALTKGRPCFVRGD
ncbi:hypothetical protein FMEAI12_1880008 [Parafrankia sp. Ea1.12]|nr:hypothetical protein FMEAI12_1880008 [Parafrankia sp. Ea1.12]